ncbi:zinc finger protein 583-like [Drosophila novamexicana]|uniref:zinc finger protein 583-like n=1 Tax=Drosophila novamexicana TaxID=47314 RepID=UPI0011E5D2BD|nr:zinc finger protein 583-like [Drosophila novamexicana]
MDQVCRVCTSSAVTLVDIFAKRDQSEEEPCLAEMLNECINCLVRRDDPFPKQICLSCVLAAQNAYRFKKRCEQSHKHFCQLLGLSEDCCEDWQFPECGIKVETNEMEEMLGHELVPPDIAGRIKIEPVDSIEQSTTTRIDAIQLNEPVEASPKSVPSDKAEQCPVCSKVFANRGSLKRHIRIHSGERPYKCIYCQKAFNQSCNLDKHMRVHSGERPYKCGQCLKAFTQSNHLANHLRIHAHTNVDELHLQPHKRTHSSETNWAELEGQHRSRAGERAHKCSLCAKAFTSKWYLQEHLRAHCGERSFKCCHCPKNFANRGDLERHNRVHSGERPYECSHCPKTFSQAVNLERHKRVHSGVRPYQCPHCHMAFTQKSHLVNHIRTHSGERPFQCLHCMKRFTRREYLGKHSRIHSLK